MNIVYNMDCMEAMRKMKDKEFDLCVCDPPYRDQNENHPTKDMRNNRFVKGQGLGKKPTEDFFNELFRVSKNQIIFGANNFRLPPYKGFICWRKLTISESFTMSMVEIAYLSEGLGTVSKYFEYPPQGGGQKGGSIQRRNQLLCIPGFLIFMQNPATKSLIHI